MWSGRGAGRSCCTHWLPSGGVVDGTSAREVRGATEWWRFKVPGGEPADRTPEKGLGREPAASAHGEMADGGAGPIRHVHMREAAGHSDSPAITGAECRS